MHLKSVTCAAAYVCASVLLCTPAGATPIEPGRSVTPNMSPVGSLTLVDGSGTPIAFTSQPTSGQGAGISGTYVDNVYRDLGNNLCGVAGQCLTFILQVNSSPTSTGGIATVTTGPFDTRGTYNVGYSTSTPAGTNPDGGRTPLTVSESSMGEMSFSFISNGDTSTLIMPGQSSSYLIIQSSATSFTSGNLGFQVAGYTPPAAATPEPTSFALLGTGLIGALGVARKRFA